jgi:phage baseplate assembly protein W
MIDLPAITQRIDTSDLQNIKNQLAIRDRVNSDRYESTQLERRNPGLIFSEQSSPPLTDVVLSGLKYPLELDGNGGLKLSSNYDRVGEQIMEVLQTRIGERVYRPFLGIPELLFESIDEYTLAQTIKAQIGSVVPSGVELEVKVSLSEDGGAQITVFYSVEGSQPSLIKYSFNS